jgi:hypothetical protein
MKGNGRSGRIGIPSGFHKESGSLREESYRQTRYPAVSAKSAQSLFPELWRNEPWMHWPWRDEP